MSENQDNRPVGSGSRGGGSFSGKRQAALLVRYGKMGYLGYFRNAVRNFPEDTTHVVVNTNRGQEIGEIVSPSSCHKHGTCTLPIDKIEDFCAASDSEYPLSKQGKVVRCATENDLNEQRHLNIGLENIIKACETLIKEMELPMSLVDAEHLLGGDRIVFYFMSESRVDFRQLVKRMAQQYQTRIEMRQIGARDEARLIADFETCGRECCCKNFLKVLKPVNMRMAKLQKATLDPSKISGRCGRLKCCLRYEDEVYTELNKKLPRKNSCVLTEDGYGNVIETHVLTQLVKIRLANDKIIAVNVGEILRFDYKPSEKEETQQEPTGKVNNTGRINGVRQSSGKSDVSPDKTEESDFKKRRRRRRNKKKQTGGTESSSENNS